MQRPVAGTALLVDVGNSAVKARVWSPHQGLGHGEVWPAGGAFHPGELFTGRYDAVVMASVVPALGSRIVAMASKLGLVVHSVTPDAAESGALIRGLYEGMGQDRVADAVALSGLFPLPALVVDAGTAVTVDLVAEGGVYAGGLIVPGPKLMIRSLASGTALLKGVEPNGAGPVLATDTVSAVAGGAHWGSICMIQGLLNLVESRGYRWRSLVLTGGDSKRVSRDLTREHVVDHDLCFKGMALVWQSLYAGTDAG
ncbi:type III pantothenate kinase [Candidatus Fermentibacteria bacterium]|nr:type III pantothenate kinase [Candidatus Fermentibacteria bacterium]